VKEAGSGARRQLALQSIRKNIIEYGHHVYVVSGGPCPRYCYSIGLSTTPVAAELVLPGASYFDAKAAKSILDSAASELAERGRDATAGGCLHIDDFGSFELKIADESWIKLMLLGALDYYESDMVVAVQLVPDREHWTIDTPDMSKAWHGSRDPAWRWLREPSTYEVPSTSVALTDVGLLQGSSATHAARWEEASWEIFSVEAADLAEDMVRAVPLATLLAVDEALRPLPSLTSERRFVGAATRRPGERGDERRHAAPDACIAAPAKPHPTPTSATPPRSGPISTVTWYRRNRPKRICPTGVSREGYAARSA